MARHAKPHKDTEALVLEALDHLERLKLRDAGADLRETVLKIIPVHERIRDIGRSLIPADQAKSARDRILFYFRRYPRTVLEGDELFVVSGIGEWARRVRELRVQFGWWIYSGVTFQQIAEEAPDEIAAHRSSLSFDPSKVKPSQYVLMRAEEDREAAHRWNTLSEIRRQKKSVKDKLLDYFRRNVGKPVTGEELRYLAKDKKEWARRTRELRTEDGWPVMTQMQGRDDLPVGAYVLEEDRQAEPHDRKIPDQVRIEVLTRDHFSCVKCNWNRSQAQPGDPRKFLELHHVTHHVSKGENTVENLLTLCNVCHDDVHRRSRGS